MLVQSGLVVLDEFDSRFRAIADTLPAYVAYVDDELRYAWVNRTYEEMFRQSAAEIVGRSVSETLGASYESIRGHLEAALRGEPQHFESRMRTAEGERFLMVRHVPDRDANGGVRGVIVHGIDITERRQAELALKDSEERLRLALTATNGIGTWDWDVPNDIVRADGMFAHFYGVDLARARNGVPIAEFTRSIHPDDLERVEREIAQALATGEDYSAEYRLIQADGAVRWFSTRGKCSLAADGSPLRFPGVSIDITERKLSEDAMMRTEKLAAVGRLASSIAHEINNPLESVVNLLYLIEQSTSDKDLSKARIYAQIAQQELARVSQIATQTLRFFKQSSAMTVVDLEELLDSVLALYQGRLLNSKIKVDRRMAPSVTLHCYEGELRQVLNNLVGNALDAMKTGGRMSVRTRKAVDAKTGRRGVRITVADSGEGMSRETLVRIFEPFFTTKGISGTGLGLWVSSGIVQKHDGRLGVRSAEGATHGTVFSLFLPEI